MKASSVKPSQNRFHPKCRRDQTKNFKSRICAFSGAVCVPESYWGRQFNRGDENSHVRFCHSDSYLMTITVAQIADGQGMFGAHCAVSDNRHCKYK